MFDALNQQGRQYEAMAFGRELGDFWKDRKADLSVIPGLLQQLEAKLLPVPGTEVLLSKTEFTVGEWKLYAKAEGLAGWQQPSKDWEQTDDHPVVCVAWNQAVKLCEWLARVTGNDWRLPTNAEWEAAVGTSAYPWGDYFPPKWDDGNYAVLADGRADTKTIGLDGILGTAPVGSFKPNALGFYDLGGNAYECVSDGQVKQAGRRILRGAGWDSAGELRSSHMRDINPVNSHVDYGFRLARGRPQSGEAGGR